MSIQESNKMIAEFMGLSIKEGVCYYTDEDDMFPMGIEVEEPYIPYDEDWNWLMPVVETIESFQDGEDGDLMRGHLYNFRIEQHFVYILNGESMDVIIEMNGDSKLDATYNAVVEFINEYNKI